MTQTRTRLPLGGFSPKKARLVRKMEDHGWTGRISSNGHAIMRAPGDSDLTCSISPKMGSGRGILNDEATFKRWMREHGERSAAEAERIRERAERLAALAAISALENDPPVDTGLPAVEVAPAPAPVAVEPTPAPDPEPEPEPEPVKVPQVCAEDGCGRIFATLQALSVHHVRAHVRVACEFCGHETAPGNMPRHTRKHDAELADPAALLREVIRLRAELAEVRAEATEWERLADEAEESSVLAQARLDRIREALGDPQDR